MSKRDAEAVKIRLERLVETRGLGLPLDGELLRWVGDMGDGLHAKLEAHGLVPPREPREEAWTMEALVEEYLERSDVELATLRGYQRGGDMLVEHFGADAPVDGITEKGGESFRAALLEQGYAEATVGKSVLTARRIFAKAVKWGLVESNPFQGVRAGTPTNPERNVFVSREDVARVMAVAPDARWRLLIALARYGALRIPSEIRELKWGHVDWEKRAITIQCVKTRRHGGHAVRQVPIIPPLMEPLQEAFEVAPEGEDFVLGRLATHSNPGKVFRQLIERAGLTPWPRPMHNLRASRANELAERHSPHVAAALVGHSPTVASRHYLRVTGADWELAMKDDSVHKSAHIPVTDSHMKASEMHSNPAKGDA